MTSKLFSLTIVFAGVVFADTRWLEWSGPAGGPLSASFPTGGITGSATATVSNLVNPLSNPVLGPVGGTFTNLTSTFVSNYGPGNPGTGLTSIGNNYSDSAQRYTVTMDFTGLGGGFLPGGSIFAFFDYDIVESLEDLSAFAPGGSQVATAWLSAVIGAAGYPDAANTGGDQSGAMPVPAPTLNHLAGVYQVLGASGNMDAGFSVYRTTTDIAQVSYTHYRNTGNQAAGTGGGGIAIGSDVPEPGTWMMLIAGLGMLALRGQRKSV